MSVLTAMEAVITIVLILLAVLSVVVIVDIHWAVMDLTALVSYLYMQKIILSFFFEIIRYE